MKCVTFVSITDTTNVVFECESKDDFNNIGSIFKLFPNTEDIEISSQCFTYGMFKASLRLDSNHNTSNSFNIKYYSKNYKIRIDIPYYYIDSKFINEFIRTDTRKLTELELENSDLSNEDMLDFTIYRHNFVKGNAIIYSKHCYCISKDYIEEILNYFNNELYK